MRPSGAAASGAACGVRWAARSPQALTGGAGGFGLQEELSQPWSGFWWTLLAVGCWWSDCETIADGVRWLLGGRRSEPLPVALADGLNGRVTAADRTTRGW